MGNHFVCENYYCQSVSFKPDWLSENIWDISYKCINENNDVNEKPYTIDKGILHIKNTFPFHILFSKKLFIDIDNIKYLSIPIHFSYQLKKENNIDIFIIFSNKKITFLDIDNLKHGSDLFFIHMNLHKNKIFIYRSFNNTIVNKKIKSKKINSFTLTIENNFKLLLFTEKLVNIKDIYEEKYINTHSIENYEELFLNLYIKSKNDIKEEEFLKLNFE